MFSYVLLATSALCVWCITPRVFRLADRTCTRRRLLHQQPLLPFQKNKPEGSASPQLFFESIARATRSNVSARDALLTHLHLLPGHSTRAQLQQDLNSHSHVDEAIQRACHSDKHNETMHLLSSSLSHGVFIPDALDHAVSITRANIRGTQTLQVATAHMRTTVRILSILPIVIVTFTAITSARFRSTLQSPAVVLLLIIGIGINRMGAWWVSRLVVSATKLNKHNEIVPLIEQFTVSVRAGLTIPEACSRWHTVNQLGSQVSQQLLSGNPLAIALQPLADMQDPLGAVVADTLIAAYKDGQPIREAAHVLATEARNAQRHVVETRVQQLSTKLSLPVVFCILPSFVLLTIVPLVFSPMLHVGVSLPSHPN